MGISPYHVAEIMTTTRDQCILWMLVFKSSVSLQWEFINYRITVFFPRYRCKNSETIDEFYLQYFSTKKLGSYADICMYSSTFVSLKTLIYSEIYIKPLKIFLFTFKKNEKYSFLCHNLSKLTLTLPPSYPSLYLWQTVITRPNILL